MFFTLSQDLVSFIHFEREKLIFEKLKKMLSWKYETLDLENYLEDDGYLNSSSRAGTQQQNQTDQFFFFFPSSSIEHWKFGAGLSSVNDGQYWYSFQTKLNSAGENSDLKIYCDFEITETLFYKSSTLYPRERIIVTQWHIFSAGLTPLPLPYKS